MTELLTRKDVSHDIIFEYFLCVVKGTEYDIRSEYFEKIRLSSPEKS